MPTITIGSRVGAIVSADAETVTMFGFGTYLGDEVPPAGIIGPFGVELATIKFENPKIQLDDGNVVWGCECWWGPEEWVKQSIGSRKVIMVAPDEYRNQGKEIADGEASN